jgi:hypothetical protein
VLSHFGRSNRDRAPSGQETAIERPKSVAGISR